MSYFKASIYALLTAPLILFNVSHASVYTTGDLSYDDETDVITNYNTGQTYLGWDVLAGKNYAETQEAIDTGGYGNYHIADKEEAKTFFEAAISKWVPYNFEWDKIMHAETAEMYVDGNFGDNATLRTDVAIFIDDAVGNYGWMMFHPADEEHQFSTSAGTSGEPDPQMNLSFLLVANTLSPVPVPAAIWLFGTALIGLVGYGKRKSKVPV